MTAPATVSGVALGNLPLEIWETGNREGAKGQHTASQETCRAKWAYTSENGLTEGEHDHNNDFYSTRSVAACHCWPRQFVYWHRHGFHRGPVACVSGAQRRA